MAMNPYLALASRLVAALTTAPDAERDRELAALLHPDAAFMTLAKTVRGAAAVAAELGAEPSLANWRALRWQPPAAVDDGVRLVGERGPDTVQRGLVVTLRFDRHAISLVQQQRMVSPAPAPTAIAIPDALRQAIDHALVERHPMLMAYTGVDGQPVLSYRGSTQVLSKDQLAMWIRNPDGHFMRSIAHNPRVAFMYRNEETKATYQLQGRARVSHSPADRQVVFERSAEAERGHDFAMLGAAVIVDLDRIEGYQGVGPGGQVGQLRMLRGAS